ncbi:hypothetical protein ACV229_24470 [Burkholderia sp. MR1-5-21]
MNSKNHRSLLAQLILMSLVIRTRIACVALLVRIRSQREAKSSVIQTISAKPVRDCPHTSNQEATS